jgi:hypothetical protein
MNLNDLITVQESTIAPAKAIKNADITLTLDISGSMFDRQHFIINGVREVIEKQKTLFDGTPFECTITINTFSSKGTYKTLCNRMPINQSEGINPKDIQCNGMTAFYDAILQTLDLEFPEETDKIHVFISDGEENDSKAKAKNVKDKISTLKSNVTIIHFGSNQPTREISEKLGIDQNCSMPYYDGSHDDRTPSAFDVCGDVLCRAVSSGNKIRFTKEEFDLLNSNINSPTTPINSRQINHNSNSYDDLLDDNVPSRY